MTALNLILIVAGAMLAVGLLTVLAWLIYGWYLDRVERRLAARKGLYRELVSDLATRDRALLQPTIHQMNTLYDLDALEAVLEEQARSSSGRPGWLLEVYDELGLVDKYIDMLRSARKWRDRAFAAELLGRVGGAKAVPALLETVVATRTEDSDVREVSLRALARIADPRAVEPLIGALETAEAWLAPRIADILTRHGEAVVDPLLAVLNDGSQRPARAWAANVLGEVRAQRAFPSLVRLLDDPEDEVRAKAAAALGRLRDQRAVGYLIEHLLTEPAPFVRVRIAASLGQFGGPQVIDRLVRSLGDPAWWVRMRSVEALEQIGGGAEGPLLVALDDADPEIRVRAAVALERLGVPDNLVRMIESGERVTEAYETLVKFATTGTREFLAELTQHPSTQVRSAVVTAINRAERRDLADELVQIASADAEASLRAQALTALRTLGMREGLPAALTGLVDQDHDVRAAAVGLVGQLGGPDIVGLLRTQTTDENPAVRTAAVRALGAFGAAVADSDVSRLLKDPDSKVRAAAVLTAVDTASRSLLPSLAELLGDSDPVVRLRVAGAIGTMGDAALVPMLLRAFPDPSAEVSEAIVIAVSRLAPEAVASLADTLIDSPDAGSKLALVRTLPRTGSDALAVLYRLRSDPDPVVRAAAIEGIGRRARRAPGEDEAGVALESGLNDPNELVRASTVDAWSSTVREDRDKVLLTLLEEDPSAVVRERAALAIGLLRVPGGEGAVIAACRRAEPPNVRAAAALAAGVFDRQSIVARVVEMPDQTAVRELLSDRLKRDARFRLLRLRLSRARHLELRALVLGSDAEAQVSLAHGVRSMLDPGDRVRLISSLRAFQGEQSRDALLQMVRSDPIPEVRTAALAALGDLLPEDELLTTLARALGDPSVLVRRAAVGLFSSVSPALAIPRLLQTIRVDDDPAVLAAAASLAEEHFDPFAQTALALPVDGDRATLIVRIVRHMVHPDLTDFVPHFARSGRPEVRAAVAELWRQRPDIADPASLEALTVDPDVAIRRAAPGAALAAERYDRLDAMTQDPDPSVRREVALVLGRAAPVRSPGLATLESLGSDADMAVRAAAYVARLLQGMALPLPPELDSQVAAQAVRESADIPSLRQTARTSASEEQRLAAGLALALLQDDVARELARSDPAPSIRHRVAGALEQSVINLPGSS
ncbi:MAG: HEAT repeat domain-containing protein [Gemmatimonadales bacterium]|nr:HEAT repeat domain-containing protein [Gemmatimonadales bacterium]